MRYSLSLGILFTEEALFIDDEGLEELSSSLGLLRDS